MADLGEQTLAARSVVGPARQRHQVLGAGHHEHVAAVVVRGNAVGRLALHGRHPERPAEPERAIGVAAAVGERKLGLEPPSARRYRDRHAEVARAGVKIRHELLAYALHRAAAVWEGNVPFTADRSAVAHTGLRAARVWRCASVLST